MSTRTLVTPEEYLGMSFEGPDREYVDGEIIERPMGNTSHSELQARIIEIFYDLRKRTPLFAYPELRHRLNPSHFRIPDVAIFDGKRPVEPVPSTPPLIAIEVVSPDDRYTVLMNKLELYRNWGVAHVWLIDPSSQRMSVFGSGGLIEAASVYV